MTIFPDLPDHSRVWVYQSNRAFTDREAEDISREIQDFVQEWAAHGNALKAQGDVLFHRFVVLAVDEGQANASGCSIDTSVAKIRELGDAYNVDFFDRFHIAWQDDDGQVHDAGRNSFQQRLNEGHVKPDTLVFNNTHTNLGKLRNEWLVPVKDSWHARVFDVPQNA